MRVQVLGFKIAGSLRVRRSKPYGNSGAKLYDYDAFIRPPKYSYLCLRCSDFRLPTTCVQDSGEEEKLER